MRYLLITGLVAALAGASSADEVFPKVMKVIVQKADVRSGPSMNSIATSQLSRDDEVVVIRPVADKPDWFAIKPPKGSYSWIDAASVKRVGDKIKLGVVEVGPEQVVKVLAGSQLENRQPNAITAALVKGSIVEIIDRPLTIDGTTWYPIAPLPSEVRYLHKSQLNFEPAEQKATPTDEITRLRLRIETLEKRIDQLEKRQTRKGSRP